MNNFWHVIIKIVINLLFILLVHLHMKLCQCINASLRWKERWDFEHLLKSQNKEEIEQNGATLAGLLYVKLHILKTSIFSCQVMYSAWSHELKNINLSLSQKDIERNRANYTLYTVCINYKCWTFPNGHMTSKYKFGVKTHI